MDVRIGATLTKPAIVREYAPKIGSCAILRAGMCYGIVKFHGGSVSSEIASDMSRFFFPHWQSLVAVILDVTIEAREAMDKIRFHIRPLEVVLAGVTDQHLMTMASTDGCFDLFVDSIL